jgi:hypothetical protein
MHFTPEQAIATVTPILTLLCVLWNSLILQRLGKAVAESENRIRREFDAKLKAFVPRELCRALACADEPPDAA